jgi:hypothetical protein
LYFDVGSQLPQQILWNKFHIRCAYFTPNCTWSLNYSVLVALVNLHVQPGVNPLKWGCTTGNAATVAHSTKKTTSGKDSVIKEQPLLLFM